MTLYIQTTQACDLGCTYCVIPDGYFTTDSVTPASLKSWGWRNRVHLSHDDWAINGWELAKTKWMRTLKILNTSLMFLVAWTFLLCINKTASPLNKQCGASHYCKEVLSAKLTRVFTPDDSTCNIVSLKGEWEAKTRLQLLSESSEARLVPAFISEN